MVSSSNEGQFSEILRKACFSALYTCILMLSVPGITESLPISFFAGVKEWMVQFNFIMEIDLHLLYFLIEIFPGNGIEECS